MITKRGICPECGEERQLTKAGVMRDHRGDIWVGGWRQQCDGVGKPPSALAADPIAAAESRGRTSGYEEEPKTPEHVRRPRWMIEETYADVHL